MELARLATSKQQATRNTQQASSTGPFLVRRAEGVLKSKKNVTTPSRIIFRNFLGNNFFFGLTPRWSQRVVYWGFGLFWAAGHLEKFRARVKNGKTEFPGARGTFGGKSVSAPKFSPNNCATFLHFAFWPTGPPGAGNRKIRVF